MENRTLLYISLSTSFIIVALSVGYYIAVYLPEKERTQQGLEKLWVEYNQQQSVIESEVERKQVYSNCASEAQQYASDLFKEKIKIGLDYGVYKKAAEQNLYLKDDYEFAFKDCLRKNGIVE